MQGEDWKAWFEAAVSGIERDMSVMARQGELFVESLDVTERIILIGLVLIGTIYLLLGQFGSGNEDDNAAGRFVGLLFLTVAVAAGLGWMATGSRA